MVVKKRRIKKVEGELGKWKSESDCVECLYTHVFGRNKMELRLLFW